MKTRPHEHPDRHRDHHEILGEGDKAKRHVAVATDTGALQFAFVDVDGFEDGDAPISPMMRADGAAR